MIPEREQEALMRLTMCAREECGMCKYQDTCNFDFQCELATKNMNILADALRADRKTEPTCSKMEQVDKDINVRSKDKPQTCSVNGRPYSECGSCEHFKCTADEPQTDCTDNCHKCKRIRECGYPLVGKCEYEPQTEREDE